ncbi:MAG: hypothetical protein PHZ09_14710, partial [Eubacteriales bacterium]|nr:hypothetical protein [Eubacteriales bacterium]
MRGKFIKWLDSVKDKEYSTELIIICLDKISKYAVRKKLMLRSLWEYTDPNTFKTVYNKLLDPKLLRN